MTLDVAVREAVAARHGLGPEAASFLSGENISELEASAEVLKRLIATKQTERTDATAEGEPVGFFAAARAAKQERQKRLAAILTQRPERPRDEAGRFARGGFDGGARPSSIPAASDPVAEHDQTIGRLDSLANTFRGTTF